MVSVESKLIVILSFFLFVVSCTSIECAVDRTVESVYQVYNRTTETVDTLHDSLYVWTRKKNGNDTLLNSGLELTLFRLPISYQHPEDTLIFCIAPVGLSRTIDTVWIKKEDIPHFESVDCSPTYFHRIENVRSTHRGIDTIVVKRSTVDYDSSIEHFRISFKTRS